MKRQDVPFSEICNEINVALNHVKLRILGFLPYTSIVQSTEVEELRVYGVGDADHQKFNDLLERMVREAKLKPIMGAMGHTGQMFKPCMDNKVCFLVLWNGKMEWLGFKDGNLWRGQGIVSDWLGDRL